MRNAALRELDEPSGEANLGQPDAHRQRLLDIAYGNMVVDVKILISIREDFLAELEVFKSRIPNLFRHRLRLAPLSRAQAEEAIVKPSQQKEILGANTIAIQPEAVREMLDFLSAQQVGGKQTDDIEPVQLQILCHSLFDRAHKKERNEILVQDLGGYKGMARILRWNYYEVVRQFPILRLGWSARKYRPSLSNVWLFNLPQYAIRQLCESGLILRTGYRNSLESGYIASRYGVPERDLEELVHQRLLRGESRLRGRFYELAHDSLIGVLINARTRRRIALALGTVGIVAAIFLAEPAYKSVQYVRAIPLRSTIALQDDEQTRIDAIIKLGKRSTVINLSRLKLDNLKLDERVFSQTSHNQWDFSSSTLSNSSLIETGVARGERDERQFVFDKSNIRNTSFDKTDLSLSSFDGANIENATFRDAKLFDASFVGATLINVDFSGASLSAEHVDWLSANFMGAKLTNVNFSNAALRNAQFPRAEIKEVNFTGTAWWLARGWNKQQIDQLEKAFPHAQYLKSDKYRSGLKERVENTQSAQGGATARATALNEVAWYRAIHGLELVEAEEEVSRALQLDENSMYLDTKAYILMQKGDFQGAKRLLALARDLLDRPALSPDELWGKPAVLYKYALALDYLGETMEADRYYQVSSSYRPTHEMLLVPRPERAKR